MKTSRYIAGHKSNYHALEVKLRAEYGPTQYDIRDIFSLTAEWEVPFDTWYRGGGQAAKLLGEGWRTTLMVNANTGLPTNINQRRLGLPSRSA